MPDDRKIEQRRDERGRFTDEFFFSEPPELPAEPPPLPSAQDERDDAFMTRNTEPPPLPPAEEEGPDFEKSVGAAQTGAKAGGMLGGPAGVALGGAAGMLLAQASQSKAPPIGAPSGGSVRDTEGSGRTLQELLALSKQVARTGYPIKDAVTTQAVGSTM